MRRREFFAMALAAAPIGRGAGRLFDVREYGARGDGKAKDTALIQKAVDACAQAGPARSC
jgi:polygalacturonase